MSPTPSERFEAFHAANPHIAELLRAKALKAVEKGHRKFGIKSLWESLRWDEFVSTAPGTSGPKLNNDYTAYYARLLMEQEPRLRGVFETRHLRAVEPLSDADKRQIIEAEARTAQGLERACPEPVAGGGAPADTDHQQLTVDDVLSIIDAEAAA